MSKKIVQKRSGYVLTTTDPVVLLSVPITDGEAAIYRLSVTGQNSTEELGTDKCLAFVEAGAVKNRSGAVILPGKSQQSFIDTELTGCTLVTSVSAGNLIITATGIVFSSIYWDAHIELISSENIIV